MKRRWLALLGGLGAFAYGPVAFAADPDPSAPSSAPSSTATTEPSPASNKAKTPKAPAVAPSDTAAPKPKNPRHNIRLQLRSGLYSSEYGLYTGDSSIQSTYFSGGKSYFAFFNFEAVFVDRRFSHVESEINMTGNPFADRPWLSVLSLSGRFTTDWTPFQTFGVGPSINLTNLPFLAGAKKRWFNVFLQYYPLKTDNHLGEQDFMFYWRVPIYKRRLYLRGFARLFIFHEGPRARIIYGNDLIMEIRKGIDFYVRHAQLIGPRRSGFSVGIRGLLRF